MNITEIGRLAGVSRATVSRYLNNGYVSKEKKERIQSVIEKNDYVPSAYAKSLRTQKSNLIGVIIPKISSAAISKIVEGISRTLAGTSYNMILANTNDDIKKEYEFLEIFRRNKVDGILFSATILTLKHYQLMERLNVPVVIIGQETKEYCCVYHDDLGAAKALALQMVKKKIKKPGFIGITDLDQAAGKKRFEGFSEGLQAGAINVAEGRIKKGSANRTFGYEAMKDIYELEPETDGIFCGTSIQAIGALEYIMDNKIPIKNNIFYIGDNYVLKMIIPQLTNAYYYYELSGQEGCKMLLEIIKGKSCIIKKVELGFLLNEGNAI